MGLPMRALMQILTGKPCFRVRKPYRTAMCVANMGCTSGWRGPSVQQGEVRLPHANDVDVV